MKLAHYRDPQECDCGQMGKRKIVATMISPDMQPWDRFISPASGKPITSYKDRDEDMKRNGCVDYEPSLRTNSTKYMEAEDAKLEKKVDATVEETISKMDSRKREKLANELTSGAECAYERKMV